MLAGIVLLSAAIGVVAMGATVALSLPTWMTLAAYPAICSLTLVICATLQSLRTPTNAQHNRGQQRHSHG